MSSFEIVVDHDDNPIGAKPWQEMQYEDIYRVSALWLTDKMSGEILLAQRRWTKKNDPGKWGTAVAGTNEEGETYRTNIVKEIEEEIGLTDIQLEEGPKTYTDDGAHKFFCQWFLGSVDKTEVDIVIQKSEVEAVKWVTKLWLINDLAQHPDHYTPSTGENLQALGIS